MSTRKSSEWSKRFDSHRGWVGQGDEGDVSHPELDHTAFAEIVNSKLEEAHGYLKETARDPIKQGRFHEIYELKFEDGWSCIARFNRNPKEHAGVMMSAIKTMEYVRRHTTIPVPEPIYQDFDRDSEVGARFTLSEKMQGETLADIWEEMGLHFKIAVVKQIADVVVQLSHLTFDRIGCLREQEVGIYHCVASDGTGRGPFNTLEEFACDFESVSIEFAKGLPSRVRNVSAGIRAALRHQGIASKHNDLRFKAPFRLIHPHLEASNLLFTWEDRSQTPQLSTVLDWDWAYTGPLYDLFEYPEFSRDIANDVASWKEERELHKVFEDRVITSFPDGSQERVDAQCSFTQKSWFWSMFRRLFIVPHAGDADVPSLKHLLNMGAGRDPEEEERWELDSEKENDDDRNCRISLPL